MTRALPIERLEKLLQDACGIALSPALHRRLPAAVERAAEALGLAREPFAQQLLAGDKACLAQLIEHAVVGETYFFRHPEQFAALRARLADDWAALPSLRIWSAGCSTGEEPYSFAMMLLDAGRRSAKDKVVATDISERSLATAREGTYGKWSLRGVEAAVQQRHFVPMGDRVRVAPAVRERVEFLQHNLTTDRPPLTGCHVVSCRNVLIYFPPEIAAKVVHSLCEALAPGGLLILGPVEVPLATALPLEWTQSHGATLLRKPMQGRTPTGPGTMRAVRPPRTRPATVPTRASAPAPRPKPPPAAPPPTRFELAREAARRGDLDRADELAREAAAKDLSPESYLLLSMTAEARGDLKGAVEQVRKALYLEPQLAAGHALLVSLYTRLGRTGEAARARRNALSALEGLEEGAILQGVEMITAGALRHALEEPEGR